MRIVLQLTLLCASSYPLPLSSAEPNLAARPKKQLPRPGIDGAHARRCPLTDRRDHKSQPNPTPPYPAQRTPYGVLTQEDFDKNAAKEGADWVPGSWKELAADGYIFSGKISAVALNPKARFCSPRSTTPMIQAAQRNQRRLRHRRLAHQKTSPTTTARWHLRSLLQRAHRCAYPAAPASRAQGHQRASFAGRSVDERRRPPLRRITRELHL